MKIWKTKKYQQNAENSGFADGRNEVSPDSEQMKTAEAEPRSLNSVSVEQIQDNNSWGCNSPFILKRFNMATITINNIEYNSYASVEEADQYLNVKYGSNWSTYDDDKKAILLVNSTREIDKRLYQGKKADENQPLKFPLIISGKQTDDELVKQACIELADGLALTSTTSSGLANLQAIESFKVGDTDVTFKDDVPLEDVFTVARGVIDNLLKQYLKGNAEVWL